MFRVRFTTARHIAAGTQETWAALVDWAGHEKWVPLTTVAVRSDEDFTAYTGIGKVALEDRMRVVERYFDGHSGRCKVAKDGPVLRGEATFVVNREGAGTLVCWHEDIQLPGPRMLSFFARPIGAAAGFMFRLALGRLEATLLDAT